MSLFTVVHKQRHLICLLRFWCAKQVSFHFAFFEIVIWLNLSLAWLTNGFIHAAVCLLVLSRSQWYLLVKSLFLGASCWRKPCFQLDAPTQRNPCWKGSQEVWLNLITEQVQHWMHTRFLRVCSVTSLKPARMRFCCPLGQPLPRVILTAVRFFLAPSLEPPCFHVHPQFLSPVSILLWWDQHP